jgi:3-methyladenine DNA glycosylase AlkD
VTSLSNAIVSRLQAAFEPARDEARAVAMSAYMRNLFPFLGSPSPGRVALEREALAGLPRPSEPDLVGASRSLWGLPQREYQYAAVGLLSRNTRTLSPDFIPVARELITTKSWWDTVDGLAAQVVGALVLSHPDLRKEMDVWAGDENPWVARTAILHQLKAKKLTDASRLFEYCALRSGDSEFFIRKAIGWALRQYARIDPDAVRRFVADNRERLSPLSVREALKHL